MNVGRFVAGLDHKIARRAVCGAVFELGVRVERAFLSQVRHVGRRGRAGRAEGLFKINLVVQKGAALPACFHSDVDALSLAGPPAAHKSLIVLKAGLIHGALETKPQVLLIIKAR